MCKIGSAHVRHPLPCGLNVQQGKVMNRTCKEICPEITSDLARRCYYDLLRIERRKRENA
jgi:hypothetical protein